MITQIKKKITQIKGNSLGQSVVEYIVILTVVLAAVLSSGFIEHMRGAFETYFNKAVAKLQ